MQDLSNLPTKTQKVVALRRMGFSFYQIAKIIYKPRDWREANRKAFHVYRLYRYAQEKGKAYYESDDTDTMSQYYESGGERNPLAHREPEPANRVPDKKYMTPEERQKIEYEEFMYELLTELQVNDKQLWETARYIHYKVFDDLRGELDNITKQKYGYHYRRKSIDSACAYVFTVMSLAALICAKALFKELLKKHILENYVSDPDFFRERARVFWRRALEKLFPL